MENKKDLAKIALAALILASTTPVNGQAEVEAHGIFLAAGCAAHGCSGTDSSSSTSGTYYNPNPSTPSDNSYSSQPYRGAAYDSTSRPTPQYGEMSSTDREVRAKADDSRSVATTSRSATLTEAQLLGALNAQGKSIYLSLDPEGKVLAIQLASQEAYKDKNLAVKEAQRRMNERRSGANR